MEEIVARLGRIVTARIAHTVVNRVVPVLTVIRTCSIPTAVVRFERIVCPANAGVRASHYDGFPFESQRPYVWRVRVGDSRLDRGRRARLQRRLLDRTSLGKWFVNVRITLDTRLVRPRRLCLRELAIAFN